MLVFKQLFTFLKHTVRLGVRQKVSEVPYTIVRMCKCKKKIIAWVSKIKMKLEENEWGKKEIFKCLLTFQTEIWALKWRVWGQVKSRQVESSPVQSSQVKSSQVKSSLVKSSQLNEASFLWRKCVKIYQ
jgi:hypothetical protein